MKRVLLIIFLGIVAFLLYQQIQIKEKVSSLPRSLPPSPQAFLQNPLAIRSLQQHAYPGSDLVLERVVEKNTLYTSYIASYFSETLKQYGLLTIPNGQKPQAGWPIVLFNHGYIPPNEYSTETSYQSMVVPLASSGYIVFKPDYRGHGDSEGKAEQVYISPGYIIDSMNALSSVKRLKDADPKTVAIVGHSMGGNITLQELLIAKDIQTAVIIAGVVGDRQSTIQWWQRRIAQKSIKGNDLQTASVVQQKVREYKLPSENPIYWDSIDPTKYLIEIAVPVQIIVGTNDTMVPPEFSSTLYRKLQQLRKNVVYKEYVDADHNLRPSLTEAMSDVITFLEKEMK